MDFEYVASGCAYLRLNTGCFLETQSEIDSFNQVVKKLNDKDNNHTFSLLYNGHTEQSFGPRFNKNHVGHVRSIYSDSGGLQILTQGLSITDAMKNKVYDNQGKWSDYGMSFDEIPVQFDGETTSRNAVEGRWFDSDNFTQKAKETGKNLNDQINLFRDMKSGCKPLFITQGNCLQTYKDWTTIALDQLEGDNIEYIGGVAMGAAALGPGPLEDIKRAFYYTQLPGLDHLNHIHLLGVGSVKRLAPMLMMIRSGLYKKDTRVSYDSTSHTSGPHVGGYYTTKMNGYNRDVTKPFYDIMYDDIKRVCGDNFYLDRETFKIAINNGINTYKEMGRDPIEVVNAFQMHIMASIDNFMSHVYRCYNSEEEILKLMKGRQKTAIQAIKYIRDANDFFEWENVHGRYIKSKSYPDQKINTLEGLF